MIAKLTCLVTATLLALLLPMIRCQAQLSGPGKPYPIEYPGSPPLRVYELPVTEEIRSKALQTEAGSQLKPAKSGVLFTVDYRPELSGCWDTLPNGLRIWRAAFHAADVSLMSLVFTP